MEWQRFLKQVEREVPADVEAHLIAGNHCAHKHAKVKAWLSKRKSFHMHFVPASSYSLELVERFFADRTEDCVRPGSFASVRQLVAEVEAYLAERNANPEPYCWNADGEEILAKVQRARKALERK